MLIFKLKPTKKSIPWFEDHKIDIRAMEVAITLLFAELEPSTSTRSKVLTLQVVYGTDTSVYYFRTDKIYLSDIHDYSARSIRQKKLAVFSTFLHEFRHWMQSRVYKIGVTQLNYTDDDVERNTNAYYRNKYEVDARQFERAHLSKFYKYYRYFKNLA